MFHPHCERPSFTLIQNLRHKYSSVYFILYIFWIANSMAKDSAKSDSKHSLTSICSEFLPLWNFHFLWLFQNILNFHPFKELITYLYPVMFCTLVSRHEHILSFLSNPVTSDY
jgi:hypothetical protein